MSKSLLLLLISFTLSSVCSAQERPLKVNDAIQLIVFGEDSLGAVVKIDSSGSVNFPLIGNVQVANKSASDVAKVVEALLERDYIRDANVTVTVVSEFIPEEKPEPVIIRQPAPRPAPRQVAQVAPAKPKSKVTVTGEIRRPGSILFEGTSADILEIIAQVGGLTPLGNPKKVQVRRTGEGGGIFKLNLNDLQSSTEPFFIRANDTIIVPKRPF